MSQRAKRFSLLLLLLLVVTVTLVILLRPKPLSVRVQTVAQGVVEATVTNTRAGTVRACRRARLSPAVGGQIAELPVNVGDTVKQGQLLLSLWNDDLKAEVELSRQQVHSNRATAEQACISADVAEREATRLRHLRQQGLAATEDSERAEGEARAKRAGCKAAQATVKVNKARLRVTQAMLARTRLLAPFDATIAELNGELGEFVTPSPVGIPTPPAFDLIESHCLYITAPIDEVDAPRIKLAMPVRVRLDAFPEQSFAGRVKRIAAYVQEREKQARTVDIDVDFTQAEALPTLLPGYSADVEVILSRQQRVLRIPSEALIENTEVYVYLPDSEQVQRRPVTIGTQNWQYTEILDGLKAGDLIVVSLDVAGLADGVSARAEENAPPP